MRFTSLLALASFAALATAPIVTSNADASVSEALSLQDLMERADRVALGHCSSSRARWEGRQIVTEITVEVDEGVSGGTHTMTLTALGGAVGSVGMRVEGAVRMTPGERAIVFARHRGGALRAVGMSQGLLPVQTRAAGDMVLPGGAGQALMQRVVGGGLVPSAGALLHERPLDEVLAELHAMAARP